MSVQTELEDAIINRQVVRLFFADTSSSSSTLTRTLKTARASLSRRVLHLLTR